MCNYFLGNVFSVMVVVSVLRVFLNAIEDTSVKSNRTLLLNMAMFIRSALSDDTNCTSIRQNKVYMSAVTQHYLILMYIHIITK